MSTETFMGLMLISQGYAIMQRSEHNETTPILDMLVGAAFVVLGVMVAWNSQLPG